MPNMKAVLLREPKPMEQEPLRVADIPRPAPGPGQVLIRVAACGVCRSNLHMIEGDWVHMGVPARSPIIPGHEVVGRIETLGPGVADLAVGDRVGVQPLWSTCGHCRSCLSGREQLCPTRQVTGETVDGGYAEYMLATAAHAHRVPDGVSDAEAAPLFCPGITAYGAVTKLRPEPGQTVALFGMGGVGHMVLQLLRLFGAEVVVAARNPRHLELAKKLGAARTIDVSRQDAGEVLRKEGGVDGAICFAPSSKLAQQAIAGTRVAGTVVIGAFADLGAYNFTEEKTILGSVIGSRQMMKDLLAIAGRGHIKTVCETFPLDQASAVLKKLKGGDFEARAVLVTGK